MKMTAYNVADNAFEGGDITEAEYDEVMHDIFDIRPNVARIMINLRNRWRK